MEEATLTRDAPRIIDTIEYEQPLQPTPVKVLLPLATWQAITSPPPEPDPGPGRGELVELTY